MTRGQRRAHLWAWAVLGVLLAVGIVAGLMARPGLEARASAGGAAP